MSKQLGKCVRYALAGCSLSALTVPAVFAQTAPAAASGQASANATQLGKIEVTGTRIKRTSVETAQPITIITHQEILASGLTTVGSVLQNITQSGQSLDLVTESHGGGGAGGTSIDLRYFGSSRVLVLVNGRRWTSGLGGTVDLSAIPSSIIDHIEILQDGASAIYGSDAITGVVNLITVSNFNGAEADAYMGIYNNNYGGKNGWDGKQQQYNFTIGSSGPRAGAVLSMSYTNQDPVWRSNRAQSVEPIWTQNQLRGIKQTLNSNPFFIVNSPALANANLGNATCSGSGSCDLGLQNMPTLNPTLSSFVNSTGTHYNEKGAWDPFSVPSEQENMFLKGHFDISDNVTFTALGSFTQRNGLDTISPQPLDFGSGGFYTANGAGFGIGANNPYNPFGKDLVGNVSQYCPTGNATGGVPGKCTPNYLLAYYEAFVPETGPRLYQSEVGSTTMRMGLNGFFDALGSEWDWDAGYSYGHILDLETESGFQDDSKLATQLDSPGSQQCNGPAQSAPGSTGHWSEINGQYYQILIPGCVPWNPFGGYNASTGQGAITPDMAAYSAVDGLVKEVSNMRDYTADLTGTLVNLPAGPLGVAVGAESLEQDGYIQPSSVQTTGNIDDVLYAVTSGRTKTQAEYVEFDIPLLSDLPMAQALSMDIANRWSQFSWMGGAPGTTSSGVEHKASATTGRAQLRWQPTNSLLLRGSWAQGFRAPSISNLYSGITAGFPVLQDPCAPTTGNGNWDPTTPLPPGCHGVVHSQPFVALRVASGGNPDLRPETAVSRSFGFVYSPSWLPGFDIGADYYKIELDNEVGSVGSTFILQQCYLSNNPQYCAHIQMNGNVISQINDTSLNVGSEYSNGIDFNADYTLPSTSIGDFKVATNWTFLRSFVSVVPSSSNASGFEGIQYDGTVSFPRAKGQVTINWNLGDWSANWNIQYIGKQFEHCSNTTIALNECSEPDAIYGPYGTTGKNQLGTTIYHDASVTYHFSPINTDFTFGIRNLFNKQFPASLSAGELSFVSGIGYRVPGRFMYARVGVKF